MSELFFEFQRIVSRAPLNVRRVVIVLLMLYLSKRLFLPFFLLDLRDVVILSAVHEHAEPLSGHYGLFVGIVSAPDHFHNRHVARHTWLRFAEQTAHLKLRVVHRFFVGRLPTSPSTNGSSSSSSIGAESTAAQTSATTTMKTMDDDNALSSLPSFTSIGGGDDVRRRLAEEQSVYGDLVQLDTLDRYERLSYKTMAMFRWLGALHGRNCTIDYVLKTDDDSYVRLDRLVAHLESVGASDAYWGFFNYGATKTRAPEPESESYNSATHGTRRAIKWTDPVFNGTHYPPYALGAGYALSMALVSRIVLYNEQLGRPEPPSRMEDASTGIYLDLAPGRVRRIEVWWRSIPAIKSGSNNPLCQVAFAFRSLLSSTTCNSHQA